MNTIFHFIKDWWFLLTFVGGVLYALYRFIKAMIEAQKCSLRNDILDIYERCYPTQTITEWELECITYSSELYFKLKGNSFIQELVNKVKTFKVVKERR